MAAPTASRQPGWCSDSSSAARSSPTSPARWGSRTTRARWRRLPEEIPAAELEADGWSKADLGQALRDARLAKAIAARVFPTVTVSEVELREKYERSGDFFKQTWRADVRVAYFDTLGPASALKEAGVTGDAFEAAARRSGARQAGGLTSVTPATPLPAPVLDAIAASGAGQVTDPIPGGGGHLVVAVDRRDDQAALTFEAARADLQKVLEDQKRQNLFADWFSKQLARAAVEVSGHSGTPQAGFEVVATAGGDDTGRSVGPVVLGDAGDGLYSSRLAVAPGAWHVDISAQALPGGAAAVPLTRSYAVTLEGGQAVSIRTGRGAASGGDGGSGVRLAVAFITTAGVLLALLTIGRHHRPVAVPARD